MKINKEFNVVGSARVHETWEFSVSNNVLCVVSLHARQNHKSYMCWKLLSFGRETASILIANRIIQQHSIAHQRWIWLLPCAVVKKEKKKDETNVECDLYCVWLISYTALELARQKLCAWWKNMFSIKILEQINKKISALPMIAPIVVMAE